MARVWKFADDIDTDQMVPGRYAPIVTGDDNTGKYCFIERRPEFAKQVKPGDIIVAGKNFGCGSSREHAPLAIKGCGVAAVVAPSFAAIFYRNAINIGLPFLELADTSKIDDGDTLEIDLGTGTIQNLTQGTTYKTQAFPEFLQQLVEKGGLMSYIKSAQRKRGKACIR